MNKLSVSFDNKYFNPYFLFCYFLCSYSSIDVENSLDFEVESQIDLGINPKLCESYSNFLSWKHEASCGLKLVIVAWSLPVSDLLCQTAVTEKLRLTRLTVTLTFTSSASTCRATESK